LGDWVIDVCILDTVEKKEEPAMACVTFLYLQIRYNEHVCLDNDGVIVSVYESNVNLHDPSDLVGKWWKTVQRRGLVRDIFAHLPRKKADDLLRIGFHDDDLIFVRVAFRSVSKRIVSLDSDFGCNPSSPKNREDIKRLLESCEVHTCTPEEAIADLSN
jgi:hypothetical protein